MAQPYSGIGLTLLRGNGDGTSPVGSGSGTETFTPVGALHTFSGPELSASTIDVTDLGNTTGFDNFILGLKHGGSVTGELFFDPGDNTHKNILLDFVNRTLRDWQMLFPDIGATSWYFTALVEKFSIKATTTTAITADLSLKISGAPYLVT